MFNAFGAYGSKPLLEESVGLERCGRQIFQPLAQLLLTPAGGFEEGSLLPRVL
jgi:hypothetical protein